MCRTTPTAALNREFEDKLSWTVIRRVISKLFFPLPVTTALAIYHSIKYIREGLTALLHGKLSVAVLDATAVTVSMVRGDFPTASSVMFMLRLGEILEDWTHKKSVADLAGAMSLNVDHVWLKTGETEDARPHRRSSGGRLRSSCAPATSSRSTARSSRARRWSIRRP